MTLVTIHLMDLFYVRLSPKRYGQGLEVKENEREGGGSGPWEPGDSGAVLADTSGRNGRHFR